MAWLFLMVFGGAPWRAAMRRLRRREEARGRDQRTIEGLIVGDQSARVREPAASLAK